MAGPSGLNWLAGGVAGAVLVPALALGAGLPFLVACAVGALAGGGLVLLLAPEVRFKRLAASGIARGKIEFARELLTEADPLVERLEAAARSIRAKTIAERVLHLAAVARGISEAVEKDPLRIDRVRRFLTYYLPRAAEMAEAYQNLERLGPNDAARLTMTGDIIDRLSVAFSEYASNLRDAELDKVDIELKLLKRSLDEDLGSPAVLDGASQRRA